MWHLTDPLRPVLGRFYAAVGSDLMLRLARRRLLLGEGSGPAEADPELPAFDPDSGEESPEQRQPFGPVIPIRASPQRFFSRSGSAAHSTRGQSTAGAPVPRASPAQNLSALPAAMLRAAGPAARDSPLHPPAAAPAGASAPTMDEGASGGSHETAAAPAASRGGAAAGLAPAETVHRSQAPIAAPTGGQAVPGVTPPEAVNRSQGAIPAPTAGQALPGLMPADIVHQSQEPLAAPPTTGGQAAPGLMPAATIHHSQEPLAAPPTPAGEAAPGLMPTDTVHHSQEPPDAPQRTGGQAAPGLVPAATVDRTPSRLAALAASRAGAVPGLMPADPAHHGQAALPPPITAQTPTTASAPLPTAAAQSPLLRLTRTAAQRWHRRSTLQAMAGSMLSTGDLVVPTGSDGSPIVPRGATERGAPVAGPGAMPAGQRAPAPAFTSHPRWSGAPEPAGTGGPGAAALRLPDALFPPLPAAALPFDAVAVGDEFLFEERVRRVLGRILRTDALRHGLTLGER